MTTISDEDDNGSRTNKVANDTWPLEFLVYKPTNTVCIQTVLHTRILHILIGDMLYNRETASYVDVFGSLLYLPKNCKQLILFYVHISRNFLIGFTGLSASPSDWLAIRLSDRLSLRNIIHYHQYRG